MRSVAHRDVAAKGGNHIVSLSKLPTEELFELLDGDLEMCERGENEHWGKVEYESMRDVLAEIKRRVP